MTRIGARRRTVWVRESIVARELGETHPLGLAEFGVDPNRMILVRARDARATLRAGHEALRCGGLDAVLIEPWGSPRVLDLTATRRLAHAARTSGVTAFLLRIGAAPQPSAAMTRWRVRAAPSAPLAAGAPGLPAFAIDLLRHRAGIPPQSWHVEWDHDRQCFRKPALSGAVAAVPVHGPAAQDAGERWRRTG
ncbi:MAG: ImuA family protein [Tranquillimonas sp.]